MKVSLTTYAESSDAIRSVRDEVFGAEQGVPRDKDWDGADSQCIHVVAADAAGHPVGTGRLQSDGRIGRLAVVKSRRRQGVGAAMLEALVDAAGRRGLERVYLHAQLQAVSFYEKRGFVKAGAAFTEAGILHINMTRAI